MNLTWFITHRVATPQPNDPSNGSIPEKPHYIFSLSKTLRRWRNLLQLYLTQEYKYRKCRYQIQRIKIGNSIKYIETRAELPNKDLGRAKRLRMLIIDEDF